jgi:hypothetical protein
MEKKKILDLKVYKNKRTGQASIILPKKKIRELPKKVKVSW